MFNNVKIIKFILIAVVLIIMSIIPGELYQGYLDQYNDFYETSFYLPDDISKADMLNELTETANKYDIYIFKICDEDINIYSSSIDIYANEEMLGILAGEYGIAEGRYNSIFSGETNINCYDFFDISDELLESDTKYYLYGDEEAMINFKEELVDKYAGSFPKNEGFNDLDSYRTILIAAWIFAIIVVILVTVYDAICHKKENFVRFTMGERIWMVYLKNILTDTIYFLLLYNILKIILKKVQGDLVFEMYSDIMFWIMLILNAVIFIRVSKIDYKLATADMTSDGWALKYNYIIAAACMIILFTSVASCVELVNTSYEYSKQEEYFEDYKEYNWYQKIMAEDDSDDLQKYLNEFISQNSSDFFYLCQGGEITPDSKEFFYEASSGSKEYLQSKISELDKDLNSELYILISKKNMITEQELSYVLDWVDTEDYEVIYYSDSVDIVYRIFDEEPITEMVGNPVILFYNKDNVDASTDGCVYEFYLGMVNGSSENWKLFADEKNINYVETNAWDYYCHRWESLSRTIIINVVIIAIMVFMYLLVSCVVIKMEFKVNAKELVIKKIYGYHIFERFWKLYGITAVISILSVLVTAFLNLFIVDINLGAILGTMFLIICIQYIFITCQIALYEKKNMQSILKGGSI